MYEQPYHHLTVLRRTYAGFLFRAQPALMTADTSATIMDTIFASPEEEARGRLLKILQDFLVSEAVKHAAKEKGAHDLHLPARFPYIFFILSREP